MLTKFTLGLFIIFFMFARLLHYEGLILYYDITDEISGRLWIQNCTM